MLHHKVLYSDVLQLSRTFYITALAINFILIIWLINKIPRLNQSNLCRYFLSILFSLTFFITIGAELLGYHYLVFLLKGVFLTFVYLIAVWFIYKILSALVDLLIEETYLWQKRFHYYIGLYSHKGLPELMALSFVIFVFL